MKKALELRQKRQQIIADMGKITEKVATEGRSFTGEEKEQMDRMLADEKSLRSTIEAVEAQEGLEVSLSEQTEQRARNAHDNGQVNEDVAFERFLRSGGRVDAETRSMLHREQRTDGTGNVVGTNTAGGYMVPQGFGKQILLAMKNIGGPLQVATIINTETGNPLPYVTLDDTSSDGDVVAENTQVPTVDLVNGQLTLNSWKYAAQLKTSEELLADNGVNLQAQLANLLGKRIARSQNSDATTAAGSASMKGFLQTATGVTSSSASELTYADFRKLKYSVDRAYRVNGTWQMSDLTFNAAMGLVDDNNRPLILPAVKNGDDEVFLGQKVIINPFMPDIGSSSSVHATPVAYGDFSQYIVRVVNGMSIKVLDQTFADKDVVGFRLTQRADGKLAFANAVKYLNQPLSS